MGAVLAKFRKPKTTYEILENLEKKINDIEEYTLCTQDRQKRYVGNFLVISIGLYVIGFLIFYFALFPPTWMERIAYSMPLLIFPLLIFLLKKLVAWYFQRKLNKNSRELGKLRKEKKKIIERVMEKETYKVAIEILNRFADKNNGFKSIGVVTPRSKPIDVLNQQSVTPFSTSQQQQQLTSINSSFKTSPGLVSPQKNIISPINSNERLLVLRNSNLQTEQKRKTPFPVINQQEQSVLEKIVDYLIGDGPQNRFAMICKKCLGHNGMALQEEFEYASFHCVYCNTLNPSRKSKPVGPKLPSTPTVATVPDIEIQDSSSTSEKESDHDSDDNAIVSGIEELTENKDICETASTNKDDTDNSENDKKSSEEKKND